MASYGEVLAGGRNTRSILLVYYCSISGSYNADTLNSGSILDVCTACRYCLCSELCAARVLLVLPIFRPSVLVVLLVLAILRPSILAVLRVLSVSNASNTRRILVVRPIGGVCVEKARKTERGKGGGGRKEATKEGTKCERGRKGERREREARCFGCCPKNSFGFPYLFSFCEYETPPMYIRGKVKYL